MLQADDGQACSYSLEGSLRASVLTDRVQMVPVNVPSPTTGTLSHTKKYEVERGTPKGAQNDLAMQE